MTMELGGRVTIECEKTNFQAELEFKLKVALQPLEGLEQSGLGPGGPPPRPRDGSGADALRRGQLLASP